LWQSGAFLRTMACGENLFPREIPFRKPVAGSLIEHFAEIRDWIRELKAHEKESKGYGYRIVFKTVNHRQLGTQNLPAQILIDTSDDYLRLIGKQKDFETFAELQKFTACRRPKLLPFFQEKPLRVLEHAQVWKELLAVCAYFLENPRPGLFLRQLDIPGADSKFIEQHSGILTELLDRVLPPDAIDQESSGLAAHGFERRYGLRHDQPLIRLRILDQALAIQGLYDLSLPLPDFARLDLAVETVFITENKINGLAFPAFPRAIVIFGLGYGIRSLGEIEWLKTRPIVYWGDIDTHGFAILSQLRGYYPQTRSLLMDRATLDTFRVLCVEEVESKRETRELPNLSEVERTLYQDLVANRLGRNLRLEQERIAFSYLKIRLHSRANRLNE
ncbi:MAG: Wadjet anti-phage system protein JetD domain-containing protein, partial [Gammaproteobacteria bacterium]